MEVVCICGVHILKKCCGGEVQCLGSGGHKKNKRMALCWIKGLPLCAFVSEKSMQRITLEENKGIPAHLLWMLAILSGVSVANLYYSQPLLGQMAEELHINEFTVNLIPMVTQIGYAAGLLFIIPLGDLAKRRNIVLTCLSVLIVALIAMGSAQSFGVLAVAACVTGICSVVPQIFMPLASQYSTPEKKSQNVGIVLSGLLTGILASRAISGLVGAWFGWRTVYFMAAVLILAAIAVILTAFPNIPTNFSGRYSELMKSLLTLFREYADLRLAALRAAICFGSFLGMWSCLTFKMSGAPFFADSGVIGLLSLCGITGALAATFLGKFIHRYGVYRFNLLGASLVILSWMVFAFGQNHYATIILGIVLIDIGMQCIQLSNQSTAFSLNPKASSRINSLFMTCYFLGGAIGTFIAGTAWQYGGWNGVCVAGAALALIVLLITLRARR